MSKISKYALSDLYDMSSGISSSKEQAGHGSPFVSFSTVFNNIFLPDVIPDLMDTSDKEQEIYSIKAGDVLITRTSETIDELAMSCVAVKDYPKATYSGFTKRLRPKKDGAAYPKYMAFYFRSELFRKAVTNNAFMTLRASFNEDIFSFLEVYLPDYDEQVKIGDMLYSIERKIQKNREINDYLEEMAKTIYAYWFIQFNFSDEKGNPYKLAGGKLVWNEALKQNIPANWKSGQLSDLAKITMGQSPSGKSYNENNIGIPFYQGSTDFDTYYPTQRVYTTEPGRLADPLDTLLSVRAPVGTLNISYEKCCIGRGLATISHPEYNEFVRYLISSSKWFFDNINNSGTTFGSITKDILCEMPIVVPSEKIINMFESKVKQYRRIHYLNEQENRKLIQLRNWLLPMLMNGQATIED